MRGSALKKTEWFITFPVQDSQFLEWVVAYNFQDLAVLWLHRAVLLEDSQASPDHSHPPHLHFLAFISTLLYFSSLCSHQDTLNFGIRPSALGNPQIQNSSPFLPPLLSPFTFPRVFLLPFSSLPLPPPHICF